MVPDDGDVGGLPRPAPIRRHRTQLRSFGRRTTPHQQTGPEQAGPRSHPRVQRWWSMRQNTPYTVKQTVKRQSIEYPITG